MGKSLVKLNKLERNWVLYDVGNSAFIMLVSTIIPIFFKNTAAAQGYLQQTPLLTGDTLFPLRR